MSRPASIHNAALRQMHIAASEVAERGGALGLNKKGEVVVEGRSWLARKMLWLKNHIFPSRTRTQNTKVLHECARALRDELGVESSVMETARAPGHKPLDARRVARSIAGEIEHYDFILTDQRRTPKSAGDVFRSYFSTRPSADAGDLLKRAGASLTRTPLHHNEPLQRKYTAFVAKLDAHPDLRGGHIPVKHGRNLSYRTSEGHFFPSFLRAALLVAVHNECPPSRAQTHKGEAFGVKTGEELAWLNAAYKELMPARRN